MRVNFIPAPGTQLLELAKGTSFFSQLSRHKKSASSLFLRSWRSCNPILPVGLFLWLQQGSQTPPKEEPCGCRGRAAPCHSLCTSSSCIWNTRPSALQDRAEVGREVHTVPDWDRFTLRAGISLPHALCPLITTSSSLGSPARLVHLSQEAGLPADFLYSYTNGDYRASPPTHTHTHPFQE